jgi:hypothetical protein
MGVVFLFGIIILIPIVDLIIDIIKYNKNKGK